MYESKRKKLGEGNLKAKDMSLESVEIFKEISKILVEYFTISLPQMHQQWDFRSGKPLQ